MIRSLIARGAAALALLSAAFVAVPASANITVKDGAGASQSVCTGAAASDSSLVYCFRYLNGAGNQEDLASKGLQLSGNASIQVISNAVNTVGTPAGVGLTVQPGTGTTFNTVVQGTSTDVGASVPAATPTTLGTIATGARGFSLQNETTGTCWYRVGAAATNDFHSFMLQSGYAFESPDSFVGTGILSVYCNVAGGVYARIR